MDGGRVGQASNIGGLPDIGINCRCIGQSIGGGGIEKASSSRRGVNRPGTSDWAVVRPELRRRQRGGEETCEWQTW